MRRPAHLHVSRYINYSPLADGRSVLAVHGYSLAVDIFNRRLAGSLMEDDLQPCRDDKALEDLLTQRGYLTGRSAEEESTFISGVRALFSRKRPVVTDFILELGDCTSIDPHSTSLEQAFLAINEIKGVESGGSLEIDLRGLGSGREDRAREATGLARDWGLRTHLTISHEQLAETVKLLKSYQAARVTLCVRNPDSSWIQTHDDVAHADLLPFRHILEIISLQTEVEVLIVVDDIDDNTVNLLFQNINGLRTRIHADANRLLTAVPVTEREDFLVPKNAGSVSVLPIRWSELFDYRQLQGYIWSPQLVRFQPSFLSFRRVFRINASGNINLTVNPGRKRAVVGSISREAYELDRGLLEQMSVAQTVNDLPDECRTCTLSLICGSNCRTAEAGEKEHFREKLQRLGSLLLLNVHQASAS